MDANRFSRSTGAVGRFRGFDARRAQLGMSYRALARRSGVSEPTLKRVLHGQSPEASFATVEAIAAALGVSVRFEDRSVLAIKEEAARRKAESIAAMTQATSGLESQGVSGEALEEITRTLTHKLMAGSPRHLWSE